jgi:hypothetical protein
MLGNMKKLSSLTVILTLVLTLSSFTSEYQILSTGMRITVLSRLGNPIENAKVTVYANRDDYENEENAIAGPAFSDSKGRVTL